MGYDLHITRRKHWSDEGRDITSQEWLAYVERDPELQLQPVNGPYFADWSGTCGYEEPWFDWWDGAIYSKNPDEAIIDKMVAMARQFGALVQGDDGELYDGGSLPPRQPTISLRDRLADWLRRLSPARRPKVEHPALPFRAGDRVRDIFGNAHTVISIDPKANHGHGMIETRRDDGTKIGHWMRGHHLTPITKDVT